MDELFDKLNPFSWIWKLVYEEKNSEFNPDKPL